ncbi:MAG: M20 family metallopeptidase [Anaerolineae bacterium]
MDRESLQRSVLAAVDAAADELVGLARFIHANPEVAMEEYKASARCVEVLERFGFQVDRGVAGLPTAFLGKQGQGHPCIGILVEYDALPGVGHGCGHNLLAGATIGAGIGAGAVLGEVPGSVFVFGTPGEEGGGGKVYMVRAGLFEGVDIVLGTHPHPVWASVPTVPGSGNSLACQRLEVEFFGQAAHAARDPFNGINALNAVIETFNGINALRQHVKPSARIHGVIRHGGDAVNVVPDYAKAEFLVRAETRRERDELVEKVRRIAEGAALITGARLKFTPSDTPYDEVVPNYTIARRVKANFDAVGLRTMPAKPGPGLASSDIGNVSYVVPTGDGSFPINEEDIPWHSKISAAVADTEGAYQAMLRAAKGLALTALDFLTDPDLLRTAREEYETALAEHQR